MFVANSRCHNMVQRAPTWAGMLHFAPFHAGLAGPLCFFTCLISLQWASCASCAQADGGTGDVEGQLVFPASYIPALVAVLDSDPRGASVLLWDVHTECVMGVSIWSAA